MREVNGFLLIMGFVAVLMLLGEWLHRIFRVKVVKQRPISHTNSDSQVRGEHRFSIRHLERYFLVVFVLFLSFLLLIAREKITDMAVFLDLNSLPLFIAIVLAIGVWWSFRKGVMR